jgi:urea transport system permease protein
LVGPIIGAFAVNGLKSWFTAAFPDLWLFALGLLFILVTLFMQKGIVGLVQKLNDMRAPKSTNAHEEEAA